MLENMKVGHLDKVAGCHRGLAEAAEDKGHIQGRGCCTAWVGGNLLPLLGGHIPVAAGVCKQEYFQQKWHTKSVLVSQDHFCPLEKKEKLHTKTQTLTFIIPVSIL